MNLAGIIVTCQLTPATPRPLPPLRTDGAGHVSAVVVERAVVDAGVVVNEVPARGVVDVAVTVLIGAVDGLERVPPDVAREFGVIDADALVEDPDMDSGRAHGPMSPGRRRA